MDATELRTLQAPIKAKYREDPASALVRNEAEGSFQADGITCTVSGWAGPAVAGLHPAAGGDGTEACSADMLLEALVACAGVTLRSVATAMSIPLNDVKVRAEGEWDARGTLGLDREVPVGLSGIAVTFEIDSPAPQDKIDKLVELTERYCVIFQTLSGGTELTTRCVRTGEAA